ncbi:hypothetical protein AQ490_12240 [Wenjunlia vitaminophila]|uniref:Uncharacterized protein n=1 Tax=Wenjunlia vitaminophila TaxID=76728 RepID=A0A0T6LKW6_WENVI|nr:ABC transporter permease subunit [Wenjunlia vitaminophila]KRV46633.1 hypothetical protein AQ490_12240 [Wenjunlia vitaminophila]
MPAVTPYRSAVPRGRDGFDRLLLAEWTKLRTVPRWMLALVAAVVLTVFAGVLVAAGAGTETAGGGGGERPAPDLGVQYQDGGRFLHRPLAEDGSLVARVADQENSHAWAKAGLMIRTSTRQGAPYAAVVVTPEHGVRFQSHLSIVGSADDGPRWLRLDRSGASVTASVSADGTDWRRLGTVRLRGLPPRAEAGLFVGSPEAVRAQRQFGGENVTSVPTVGKASFDGVRMDPDPREPWRGHGPSALTGPGARDHDQDRSRAGEAGPDGVFTVTGAGDIGRYQYGHDTSEMVLSGVLVGMMAIVALAVLFVTSEYRQGVIRTTFTASPRRGRVLAAKAVVIGAVTFVAGLVAAFGTFLLADAVSGAGLVLPALSEGPVLRAVVGTAAVLAVVAVFSLGVAALLRRAAAAITVVLLVVLVPQVVASGMPLSAARWLERLTPAAGLAIQQTVVRYDTAIGPWAGFGVLCGYAAVTLVAAGWRLRRGDA